MQLNQEILLAYKKRWQIVANKEEAEQRNTTTTERWRKTNALLRMAAALDLQMHQYLLMSFPFLHYQKEM